jgi:uncharacterized protein (TIRG00374 family)
VPTDRRQPEGESVKRFVQFATSLIIAGLILFAVLWRFDVREMLALTRQARVTVLMLGVALMVVAYLLRGARWQIWERSLSYWDSLRLVLIGFMGNNVLPARLGEILRAHCASSKAGNHRGRTALLASVTTERILDGLVLAIFGVIGIALVPVDGRLRWALLTVSLVFAGLASGIVLGIFAHEWIRSFLAGANRRFPGQVTAFASNKASHFLDGLLALGTVSRMFGAIFATAIIWTLEVGFYYFVGLAVWPIFSIRIAVLFVVVVNFASIIPFTMGGIGTIEAIAPPFLIGSGVAPPAALAMVLIQHATQLVFTTLTGGIVYLAGGFYRIPINDPKAAVGPRPERPLPSPVVETTLSG